jgi:hypothetical protein
MTERSYYWDGLVTGDAVLAPYATTVWNDLVWETLFQRDSTEQSVLEDYLNELVVSGVSGGVKVATGAALVNGTLYENTVALSLAIETPSSDPRIDRIVLRKTWVDQKIRLAVLQGTEAASPTAPTLTQSEGDTWEVSLAQVRITIGGVITVTDERLFSRSPLAGVVTIAEIETISGDGVSNLLTFDNIPQIYKHLRLEGQFRIAGVAAEQVVSVRFNNDTDNNYHTQGFGGADSSTSAAGAANQNDIDVFFAPATDADANHAVMWEAWIDNYRDTTFHKTIDSGRVEMPTDVAADLFAGIQAGMWLNTDAIQTISILVNNGVFATGTKVTLYGVV